MKKAIGKVSQMTGVDSYLGDTIEEKVRKIMNNNEPIKDGAPLIYTDRKDGVKAGYNIKTDRFEVAVDAMDKVTKSHVAKRAERAKVVDMKGNEVDGKPESIQDGTGGNP